jgi:hypothetical protein
MTFVRDFFEELNDNVKGALYLVDKSSLKPMGIGTIRFKLPRFLDFFLHDVLYLLELRMNLLFRVHLKTNPYYSHV